MWRALRIAVLSLVLLAALGVTWGDRFRTTRWSEPLWVGIFPLSADGRPATAAYIKALDTARFAEIETFFSEEARRYGLAIERPLRLELHEPVAELPPAIEPGTGVAGTMLWSLKLRWYAWRMGRGKLGDVRMFVLFHDPAVTARVPHSVGLQRGLVGVVHAYADPGQDGPNNVVIAHEFLHTVGATDKYDPRTLQPLYPEGYGEPDAERRHPQVFAEIMAGRRAVTADEAEMPADLGGVLIGPVTAAEINWIGR
jgi:hypothetical protein